jgi:hypothetical protein
MEAYEDSSKQHMLKSKGRLRAHRHMRWQLSLYVGSITRPTAKTDTRAAPANTKADAALCARAPLVNVSSTKRIVRPLTSVSTLKARSLARR